MAKKFIVTIIAVMLGAGALRAEEFLIGRMIFSPRPAALGGAYAGLSNDLAALEYNPAGLAFVKKPQICAGAVLWYDNTQANSFAFATSIKNKFGVGVIYKFININDTARSGTDTTITELGDIGYKTSMAALAVGYDFKFIRGLSEGVAIKMFGESLSLPAAWSHQSEDEFSISAIAFDYGIIYLNRETGESFGLSLQNLGQSSAKLPSIARLGGSQRISQFNFVWEIDYQGLNNFTENILAANALRYGAGLEYKFLPGLILRAGLKYQRYLDITGGLGLSFKNFYLDYCFAPQIDLGNEQRMSFTVKF
jgi:hypothetical protein